MAAIKQKRTCTQGHVFFKSTDCPACPVCESMQNPASGFLSKLSSPARNALLHKGIDTIDKLSNYTQKEVLALHGIGKASLPALTQSLAEEGRQFKSDAAKN